MEKEYKGLKEWFIIKHDSKEGAIFSKELIARVCNHKDNEELIKTQTGEIAQCWEDFYDGTLISNEEMLAHTKMISNSLNTFEMLKEVKQYLIDNSDVLAPFPTRSLLDKINETLNNSLI